MNKLLPIITIGFLVLSGIGAIAQTTNLDQQTIFIEETEQQSFDRTHTVFAEYGTATWCGYCKYAHGALKNIYASGSYPFYYVSLVDDKNGAAASRNDYYNIYGFPTVWFDGGYKVNVGAGSVSQAQTAYEASINQCLARAVEDVDITLSVEWLGGTEMSITARVKNNEAVEYGGHVRVYITEKVSSMGWTDTNGDPYTFPLLYMAFDEPLTISSGSSWTDSLTWDGSSYGFGSITEENIMVIGVVFNDEWHQGYSYTGNQNPFDAYYVDDCIGVEPGQGGSSEPPVTPTPPSGPTEVISAVTATYTTSTTDPDGDNILYQFDWGNGILSGWYGPEPSGASIEGSYAWPESGTYDIRVRAKDDNGSIESDWSDPTTVTVLAGPDLDITEIQGGLLKVTTTIENIGEAEATDVNWNIACNGGILLLNGGTSGTIASIPAGDSQEISSAPILGFGKTKVLVTCEMTDGPSDQRQQGATVLLFFISMSPGGGF